MLSYSLFPSRDYPYRALNPRRRALYLTHRPDEEMALVMRSQVVMVAILTAPMAKPKVLVSRLELRQIPTSSLDIFMMKLGVSWEQATTLCLCCRSSTLLGYLVPVLGFHVSLLGRVRWNHPIQTVISVGSVITDIGMRCHHHQYR